MNENTALDFTKASDGLASITDGITTFFTDNWSVILGVVAIPLGFWLVRFCIRLIKSLSSSSK